MNKLERFARQAVIKLRERIGSNPSENLDFLLTPCRIELLVAEGRTPLRIGTIDGRGAYYQVPPIGFNPSTVEQIHLSAGGAYSFVNKTGREEIGSTYTLTLEQAQQVEERIILARKNLDRS